jgi:PEGA domain
MFPLLLLAMLANAGEEPPTAPAPRAVVTVIALPHPEVPDELASRLLQGLSRALAQNARLDVKDAQKLLANFAGDEPTGDIDTARALAKAGQDLLGEVETRKAIQKLGEAIKKLELVMPFIHKQELAEAMMNLAVAEALEGNRQTAKTIFAELLVWRPKMDADANRVPPQVMALYDQARDEVARLPRGSLEIHSEPEGALAFVDGHQVGTTPTTVEGLTVGRHFVTFKKDGFLKRVVKAHISAREQQSVTGTLDKSKKYLLLQQAIEQAEETFGREQTPAPVADLRTALVIDQVVFLKLARPRPDHVEADAAMYDLRTKRRLSRVRQSVSVGRKASEREDRVMATLAQNLYFDVRYDGRLSDPVPEKPPEPERRRPFYAQWWFWTAVGVAAAAAVVIPLEALPDDRSTPGYRPAVITF